MSKITIAVVVLAVALAILTGYMLWANNKNAQSQIQSTHPATEQTETTASEAAESGTKTPEPTAGQTATTSGLKIETIKQGTGDRVTKAGDMISVNYVGTLADTGKKFDSSLDRNKPFDFDLGAGEVIKGWDQGLIGMKVGEERKLTIPPSLGYGANGYPPAIPANATLIFDVTLVAIK